MKFPGQCVTIKTLQLEPTQVCTGIAKITAHIDDLGQRTRSVEFFYDDELDNRPLDENMFQ